MEYLGLDNDALIDDALANPSLAAHSGMLATGRKLRILQIVGGAEILLAENLAFYNAMKAAGQEISLHIFDQMWHVFPMYLYGCESKNDYAHYKAGRKLQFAEDAFTLIEKFTSDDEYMQGLFYHFSDDLSTCLDQNMCVNTGTSSPSGGINIPR